MADPRAVLERELERIDARPFTLDRFLARREQKRRNQRIAAGALGLTVAAVTALVAARALSVSPERDIGTAPTATSSRDTTRTVPFESRFHGYSLRYPEPWEVRRAEARWTTGWLSSANADRFIHPTGGTILQIASIPIPERMTTREWLDREDRRHAPLVGLESCEEGEHGVLPTEVDGVPGRYAPYCGLITVVVDRRGYVIRVHADLAVRVDVRQVVESIRLHPEEV